MNPRNSVNLERILEITFISRYSQMRLFKSTTIRTEIHIIKQWKINAKKNCLKFERAFHRKKIGTQTYNLLQFLKVD